MTHVVQLTSAHPRGDTRIMHKQCRSLASAGYQVTLVVADGRGDETRDGIHIRDVGRTASRSARMVKSAYRVYREALRLDAKLYHLHDPELVPWGLLLKRKGAPVVFDAHEDLPAQIRTKFYLPRAVRTPLARLVGLWERRTLPGFDGLVGATTQIANDLSRLNVKTVCIANYPLLDEFKPVLERQPEHALFVGSISRIRGIETLVDAMGLVKPGRRLRLAGPMAPDGIAKAVDNSPGRANTDVLGEVTRDAVAREMGRAVCGVVTFLDAPNHVSAQPNKLFEYMSAGIPVIASHFPLWRVLVEDEGCGICVDPNDACAIAAAVDYLFDHPDEARAMGERGRKAVEDKLNWERQAIELGKFYASLGAAA